MIERERFDEIWDEWKEELPTYSEREIDHTMKALILLREKIPYTVCPSIIGVAEYDVIYLCDIDKALLHIDEQDLKILIDCNVYFDKGNDCFYMFA